jgi:tyrosine-protein kinase Etk/Wzc
MNTPKDQEDKILFCVADIISLFRQSKKKILCWALTLGFLGVLWALMKPIHYQAEGTFREKGIQPNNSISSSILQFIGGGINSGGESEAASLMISRKILKEVIEKLHLQAHLESLSDIETVPKLIRRNLHLVWASTFSRSPRPVLKEICCPLKIGALQYEGEIPLTFLINLHEDHQFEVFDAIHSKNAIGRGKLREPFQLEQFSITLVPTHPDQSVEKTSFIFTLNSLTNTAKNLGQILKVEYSKTDKSLLTLKFEHRNRKLASQIINTLMESYQSYLKNYHAEVAFKQLDYLGVRRDQLTKNLMDLMEGHADLLSKDLYKSGFIESDKEMDFLAQSQHEYKRKLLDNELEIKRLKNIQPGNLAYYDRYSTNDGDPAVINAILSEMRALKQQRDSLEIELQKKPVHQGVNLEQSFEQHLNMLKEVQQHLLELKEIANQYDQGKLPDPDSKLLNDTRFLLKGWFERLQEAQKDHSNHWNETNENFRFYLTNLERLFGVHERILKERLTHQQNPSGEYQGISFELATQLYLDYSKQLVQMEGTIRQNLFFIHQIEDPNFEITSLSSGLTDPVSNAMIQKASDLVLNLRDQNNQSLREQERIKNQLDLQRTFLTLHLKQMVQLMELNKQLIDEKVFALQNVSLELIHQRISLLEKNLQDYLQSRLHNLHQERSLIQRHLESIHADMSLIPPKWVSEQLLHQTVATNQGIVEEIVKLVESKNISHNLEVIRSAPVDLSIPPVHPIAPRILLWGFLGFILGGMFGSCFILGRALSKGLKVSPENLELMGYHVSGILSPSLPTATYKKLREYNLNTLRRLQGYFDSFALPAHASSEQKAKFLLLIEGEGPDYAGDLADLFLKRERRILTLDLSFTETTGNPSPGLLQYLKGEISKPPIQKGEHGDCIKAGGASDFAIEMVGSPIFQQLIEQIEPNYDWILVVSRALPCSVEAESLLALFPCSAVTLKHERIEELYIYTTYLKQSPPHKLTFILDHDSGN